MDNNNLVFISFHSLSSAGCEAVDELTGGQERGKQGCQFGVWIEFVEKGAAGVIFDACLTKQLLDFVAAVAAIGPEVLREEADAAQGIVPPIMEVYNSATIGAERAGDVGNHNGIVGLAANERVHAEDTVEGVAEGWREIIGAEEKNVSDTEGMSFTPAVVQILDGEVAMENEAEEACVAERVIAGSGSDVAED
jgi:hypothetical protein